MTNEPERALEFGRGIPPDVRIAALRRSIGTLTCRCGQPATVVLNAGQAAACRACVDAVRLDLKIARQKKEAAAMRQTRR